MNIHSYEMNCNFMFHMRRNTSVDIGGQPRTLPTISRRRGYGGHIEAFQVVIPNIWTSIWCTWILMSRRNRIKKQWIITKCSIKTHESWEHSWHTKKKLHPQRIALYYERWPRNFRYSGTLFRSAYGAVEKQSIRHKVALRLRAYPSRRFAVGYIDKWSAR